VYSLCGDDEEGDTDAQMDRGLFAVFSNRPVEIYQTASAIKIATIPKYLFIYSQSLTGEVCHSLYTRCMAAVTFSMQINYK